MHADPATSPARAPVADGLRSARYPAGKPWWAAALAILLLAAGLRFWALDFGVPNHRTRPDEYPVIQHTRRPALGMYDVNWSVYPHAYVYATWLWTETGLRVAQGLGLQPDDDYAEIVQRDPTRLYPIARSLSAVAGTAAVLVLMLLTRGAFGNAAALAAGVLLATSFLHARDSHGIKPDVLQSLATVGTFALLAPLLRRPSLRSGAVAGLGVGAAMAAKYPGLLLALPVYAAAVMSSAARGWKRLLPGPAVAAGISAAAFFVLTSPYLVLDSENYMWVLRVVFPQLFGVSELPGDAPPVENTSGAPAGIVEYGGGEWWEAFAYHAGFSLRYGMGLLPALLAPFALVWGFASRIALARCAALFATLYFVVIGLSPAIVARYMTPLVPVLYFLEAGMLWGACTRIASHGAGIRAFGREIPRVRAAAFAMAVATLLLAAEPLAGIVAHNRIAAREDTRVQATRWMEEKLPRGARLVILGEVLMPYGRPLPPRGSKLLRVEPSPEKLAEAGVGYVVMHEHELYSSTVDPEIKRRLAPRLELLVEFDPYTERRSEAVFEEIDPYYIPFHGFAGVELPGPRVRIYRFE
ncbi:MAG: glycosyltransferase family 39 protein [Deltaproteobacteria bacterium]|nr:glycosyltransferase family 39 protein [Deltaproteobacteria bacterium]MBW2420904.1 glycosyltransferase family 39 protein [Deltaproteobacteria bacterium]